MSQRRSSPTGFFSPAEDKLKLSDDVIEDNFIRTSTAVYYTLVQYAGGRSVEGRGRRTEERDRRTEVRGRRAESGKKQARCLSSEVEKVVGDLACARL